MKNKRANTVVIFGAGGHAKVCGDIFESTGIKVAGLFDDDIKQQGKTVVSWKIVGTIRDMIRIITRENINYFIALGDNHLRQRISNTLIKETRIYPINCLSNQAIISSGANLAGKGIFIAPGAVINVGSLVEDGVIINTLSSIDHDCKLAEFSSVQPGASVGGGVEIGKRTMIGIGASVRQYVKIGHDSIVGGGAMLLEDVGNNIFMAGVPAIQKRREI